MSIGNPRRGGSGVPATAWTMLSGTTARKWPWLCSHAASSTPGPHGAVCGGGAGLPRRTDGRRNRADVSGDVHANTPQIRLPPKIPCRISTKNTKKNPLQKKRPQKGFSATGPKVAPGSYFAGGGGGKTCTWFVHVRKGEGWALACTCVQRTRAWWRAHAHTCRLG